MWTREEGKGCLLVYLCARWGGHSEALSGFPSLWANGGVVLGVKPEVYIERCRRLGIDTLFSWKKDMELG